MEFGDGKEVALSLFSDVDIEWPCTRSEMIFKPGDVEIGTLAEFQKEVDR